MVTDSCGPFVTVGVLCFHQASSVVLVGESGCGLLVLFFFLSFSLSIRFVLLVLVLEALLLLSTELRSQNIGRSSLYVSPELKLIY